MPNLKSNPNLKVSTALSLSERTRLFNFATVHNVTPSAVMRGAITHFLDAQEAEQPLETGRQIERSMRRMEERLATLMAKSVRASAQTMYYALMPLKRGNWPSKPITQSQFDELWAESRHFAHVWLQRAKLSPPEPSPPAEEDDENH